MEFKYILTESEMIAAMKLHGKGSLNVRISLVLFATLLTITAIFTSYKIYPILMVSGGLFGYFVVYMFVIPFQARKQYKELKSIQSEMRIIIEEDGIKIDSCAGNSNLDWSYFKKWAYNKEIILLYITSKMFYLLPRRVIESEKQFKNMLEILDTNIGGNA